MSIRPVYTLLLTFLLYSSAIIGQNVRQVFSTMPDDLIPYVEHNTRLDLIDFHDSGMKAQLNNVFGEPVILTHLSDQHLILSLSDITRLELAVLPTKRDSIVCLVMTMLRPVAESRITFYDKKWQPLSHSKKYLPMPNAAAWMATPDRRQQREWLRYADYLHVTATLADDGATLVLTPHLAIPDTEQAANMKALLHPDITLHWRNGRFVAK